MLEKCAGAAVLETEGLWLGWGHVDKVNEVVVPSSRPGPLAPASRRGRTSQEEVNGCDAAGFTRGILTQFNFTCALTHLHSLLTSSSSSIAQLSGSGRQWLFPIVGIRKHFQPPQARRPLSPYGSRYGGRHQKEMVKHSKFDHCSDRPRSRTQWTNFPADRD